MDNYTLRQPDPASMMPMAMASDVDRRTHGGRVAGTWRWNDDLKLEAGVDGSTNLHRARNGGPPGSTDYFGDLPRLRDAGMATLGAFGEVRWTFAPGQRWITGARLDRASAHGYRLDASNTRHGRHGRDGRRPRPPSRPIATKPCPPASYATNATWRVRRPRSTPASATSNAFPTTGSCSASM